MRATCLSSWIRPYRFIMHQGYSGMAIFDPQLQIDSLQVFRHSPDADIEYSGNLIARLALHEPLKDFSFSRGQAKREQLISRQLQQVLLEQYGGKCTVVHIPNGEASGRSIDGQRSKFYRDSPSRTAASCRWLSIDGFDGEVDFPLRYPLANSVARVCARWWLPIRYAHGG